MEAPVATTDVFRRLTAEPAYKAVSTAIERAILGGALPPGSALPTEQELAERFGVHRSTVREAIRRVKQEGLPQRRGGRVDAQAHGRFSTRLRNGRPRHSRADCGADPGGKTSTGDMT